MLQEKFSVYFIYRPLLVFQQFLFSYLFGLSDYSFDS